MSFVMLPQEQSPLSLLAQSLGTGIAGGLQQRLQDFHNEKALEEKEQIFKQQGYPEDLAKLAAAATTGGQTEVLRKVLEEREIGPLDKSLASPSFTSIDEDIEDIPSPPIGRTRKEKERYSRDLEKRNFERNKKYLDRISDIAAEIPKEKMALAQVEGALQTGDFNTWRNALADLFDKDILKTSSAQIVNSASKQYLMSSLAGLTGRPNQFIERQITRAFVSPQYQSQANKLIFEGLKGLADLKEKEVEIALELENRFTSQGKEIPRNFQHLVRKKLENEAKVFEKSYEQRIKSLLGGAPDRQLSRNSALEILQEAGGDKEKARKIAKKRGFNL